MEHRSVTNPGSRERLSNNVTDLSDSVYIADQIIHFILSMISEWLAEDMNSENRSQNPHQITLATGTQNIQKEINSNCFPASRKKSYE